VGTSVESGPCARDRASAVIRIRMLGPLAIELNGSPIELPASRKACALLAYLALTRRPAARSRLCELLWDGAQRAQPQGPIVAQGCRGSEENDRPLPNARDLRSECPKLRSRARNRTFSCRPVPVILGARSATCPAPNVLGIWLSENWSIRVATI
jgi:hypothetical protein